MTDQPTPDLAEIARKHGVSTEAVEVALRALQTGNGHQAQFRHDDLGGMGQWSRGGMLMIGDMFNHGLKAKVAALFDDLLPVYESLPAKTGDEKASGRWPAELGRASSTGSQNGSHYAIFPDTRRLALEKNGTLTVYDTGDHHITGIGQQQSGDQHLRFTSADGPVSLDALTRVDQRSGDGAQADGPAKSPPSPPVEPTVDKGDVEARIGRLHDLLTKGALTQDEFDSAKRKLLDQI